MSIVARNAGPGRPSQNDSRGRRNRLFWQRGPLRPRRQASSGPRMAPSQPVLIKRYDGHRLYRADAGTYLTLDDLAVMVEDDDAFTVREAATGEDITPSILKQIIG
jgi:hypothetical protein